MKSTLKLAVAVVVLTTGIEFAAMAQGTAFTYQGSLNVNGTPANGSYDLVFSIWASANGTNDGFAVSTNSATAITGGLFTVVLDFGAGIFTGPDRWLQIDARTNGSGPYTSLRPRQQLTPTPYAITAGSVTGQPVQQNTSGAPNVIAGSPGNYVTNGVVGATIAGGGATNYFGQSYTNTVTGNFGTVGGGYGNTSGFAGVVGGGYGNTSGFEATVSGGEVNAATNFYATVGGGDFNASGGQASTVGGGEQNIATALFATISGGELNQALGQFSAVGGGAFNIASGFHSFIGGGRNNLSSGFYTVVGGGIANAIAPVNYATVGGGWGNTISNNSATVSGGQFNVGGGLFSAIGGGASNVVSLSSQYATIGGGRNNTANTDDSAVSGGRSNNALGTGASVGGGAFNAASGPYSIVGGGYGNGSSNDYATVSGGYFNVATNNFATVPGGYGNSAGGPYSFAAGNHALAAHQGSFVWSDSQGPAFGSAGNDTFNLRAQGGVWLDNSTRIFFGNQTRQTLNLYNADYGVGVQSSTEYFRAAANATFSWFVGGVHNDGQNNPGGGVEVMRLATNGLSVLSGDVGIGTSVPQQLLHLLVAAGHGEGMEIDSTNAGHTPAIYLNHTTATGHNFRLASYGDPTNSTFRIRDDTPNFNADRFAIDINGNVGIGTIIPTNKLHVIGGATFASGNGGANQAVVWTPGSASWSFTSDRNTKDRVSSVDTEAVLKKLTEVPVKEWNYIGYEQRHIGPMAQDFHEQFPLSADDKSLNEADLHGVTIAAVQGLNLRLEKQLQEKEREIQDLKTRLERLEQLIH